MMLRPHIDISRSRVLLRSSGSRVFALTLVWIVLTEGSTPALAYGLPVVAIAVGASLWLHPPTGASVSLVRLSRFAPTFILLMIMGGIDAALRALRPSLPIDPDLATFMHRYPTGPSGIALAYTIGLQPGTIVVDIEERAFRLHVIDRTTALDTILAENAARLSAALEGQ